MRSAVLIAPAPLAARTGGYIYDRKIADGLGRLGWQVDVLELDSSFPYPTSAALQHADRALAGVRPGTIALVDSLALGAMPELITREASRLAVAALVHLPLAAAAGLDDHAVARFEIGERIALHAAALIIVTGRAALPLIARYGVPSSRVVIIEPGTDRAPLALGSRNGDTLELLTVANVNAEKGHDMLLTALAAVPERRWRLSCAGSLTRDPATACAVRSMVSTLGLEERVSFLGDLDPPALAASYQQADLFVLATRRETYGMAVAEALAHGLPVVATATGAIPELVAEDAGLLVPVGDTTAFAEVLSRVMGDADLRARLAAGARRKRLTLPSWEEAAGRMAAVLDSLRSAASRG